MVLEVAVLDIIPGLQEQFEANFKIAQNIISSIDGYRAHQLQKCLEISNRYILLVEWETLEDHTIGFRKSEKYEKWKILLHHFYSPFPHVEHYELISNNHI